MRETRRWRNKESLKDEKKGEGIVMKSGMVQKDSDYVFPFERLDVWHKSKSLVKKVYGVTKVFPTQEQFGLTAQMNRSAVSIASNIAEGSARSSRRDQARFTEIAFSSLMELFCQLIISNEIGLISNDCLTGFRSASAEIARMLNGLSRYQKNYKSRKE
jgi:four helix bundle protein